MTTWESPLGALDAGLLNGGLHDVILRKAEDFKDRTAMVDVNTGEGYTYGEFRDRVRRLAGALWRMGVKKSDVVGIYSTNCLEYPIIFHAVLSLGGIVTTCNPLSKSEELLYLLEDSRCSYLFTSSHNMPAVEAATDTYTDLKSIIVLGDADPGYMTYDSLMANEEQPLETPDITVDASDVASLPYSSGTTGTPKGVMVAHRTYLANLYQMSHPDVGYMESGKEVSVCCLPLFHLYGLVTYLSYALYHGTTVILFPRYNTELLFKTIETYKVTVLQVVPPIVLHMVQSSLANDYDTSSLHTIACAAAPIAQEMVSAAKEKYNLRKFKNMFGLTETAITFIPLNSDEAAPIHSVGKILPSMQARITDTTNGETLGPDETGEICVKGPLVMNGYFRRPDETTASIDKDGFFHTGDIGSCDNQGNLVIVDRLKEILKYKGSQVAPAELEGLLIRHNGVTDAAVVGTPDLEAGDLPMAFVVRVEGSTVTEKDIQDYVAEHVAPHKKLRGGVVFVDTIPKSPSGKILRRILREQLRLEAKTDAAH